MPIRPYRLLSGTDVQSKSIKICLTRAATVMHWFVERGIAHHCVGNINDLHHITNSSDLDRYFEDIYTHVLVDTVLGLPVQRKRKFASIKINTIVKDIHKYNKGSDVQSVEY
jgi:hypothetical protein